MSEKEGQKRRKDKTRKKKKYTFVKLNEGENGGKKHLGV